MDTCNFDVNDMVFVDQMSFENALINGVRGINLSQTKFDAAGECIKVFLNEPPPGQGRGCFVQLIKLFRRPA